MEKVEKGAQQKERQMNKNSKILMLVAVVLVLAVLAAFVASYEYNQRRPQAFPFRPPQQQANPSDIELYLVSRTVVSTINIALLLVLVITYLSIFLKTKSEFTIGLLIFSLVFLLKDIASSPFMSGTFGFGLFGIQPFQLWFVLLPDVFELAALSILMYLSIKY
jgi:hypothetical protein